MTDHFKLSEAEEQQIEAELARLEPPKALPDPFACVVIVDGLPVVPAAKLEKLKSVLRKLFVAVGPFGPEDMNIVTDAEGNTLGYGFVEYESAELAAAAVKQLNNHKLDKQHTLLVNLFSDFEKFDSLPKEFEEPKTLDVPVVENLRDWLEDPRACDQYVIRFADRTEIYWNEQKGAQKADLAYSRDNWTDSSVQWSPLGTYLVTMHRQGIAIWGGPSWKRLIRLQHPAVESVEFSPCEKFLVTFSPSAVDGDDPEDPRAIVIWDVRTGRKLRAFTNGLSPFRWSHDDRFFARLGENLISVYETPSMMLHNRESLKVPGVKDFAWSPASNALAYFVPEEGTRAARGCVVEWPSRTVLRSKNLFNVDSATLHWQSNGTYLCVKVDRSTKSKTPALTNFEVFRMREKDIPVDVLELKEKIVAFAWEPKGKRMCIIHGEGSRPDVSFYAVEKKGIVLLSKLDKRPANSIFWSPRGKNVVLAGLRTLNGQLEFYNAQELETMAQDEHFMASTVEWDPTGSSSC